MKMLKHTIIIVLTLGCIVAVAQAIKQDINSSLGNGEAMEYNLNEPNAVNPAKDNIQKHEIRGEIEKNIHPKTDLANDYNRNSLEGSTK